ncbi:Dolichyl-phosphate-mannose--protein mannosyltransferase 1 [Porphyridium purpureum]|uniref:Dolichyl-phosphate-mannose--protein mannosyltransferase 1 n=1 Tax=Porphyridium purpureum TaxID=35688 RepID=A0A5J4Z7B2_PORPP|nr:Dolichyl-phosphate-mannose--protein mannosyltransferase 1 [Porphyridium purpureum]|eukprot:POR2850..scf295_1
MKDRGGERMRRRSVAVDGAEPVLTSRRNAQDVQSIDKKGQTRAERRDKVNQSVDATSSAWLDALCVVSLVVAAGWIRLYRIAEPAAVVFDEFHFARFLTYLSENVFFFDIHPPLAKLIMFFSAKFIGGFPPRSDLSFLNRIGNPYPDDFNYVTPRVVAAIFGTASVPLMYLTGRQVGLAPDVAFVLGCFVAFDMNHIIESRLVLTDSQLIFFCALSLLLMTKLWKSRDGSAARYVLLVSTGLACGACMSVKFTGLATPAVTGLVSLVWVRIPIWQCALIGMIGLALFACAYAVLFSLMQICDPKEIYHRFVSVNWGIKGDPRLEQLDSALQLRPWGFWTKLYYMNREMISASARIKTRHEWESKWYEWALSLRGILYFSKDPVPPVDADQTSTRLVSWIYLIGNPVVYWTTFLAVLIMSALILLRAGLSYMQYRAPRKPFKSAPARKSSTAAPHMWKEQIQTILTDPAVTQNLQWGALFLAGFLINLLPYIGIERCAFLYHYLPGLWYAILMLGLLLQIALGPRARVTVSICLCVLAAAAFWYFSPWVYGTPISLEHKASLQWLPRWN